MTRLTVAVALLLLPLTACSDVPSPPAQAEEEMPLLMPMVDGQWHRQGRFFVMELAHGWLVREPYSGSGKGMCFVPKPTTITPQ
jgi:hypothetical protein